MSAIESVSHETRIFNPSEQIVKNAVINSMDAYHALCKKAYRDWETDRKSTRLNSSHRL